jgi:hypothetical protein
MVCVGGPSYNQSNGKADTMEDNDKAVERLAQQIFATWMDSMSDDGSVWRKSNEALKLAKQEAGEELVKQAYELAKERYENLGR